MIKVGKNCLFGPAVTIATVGHPIRPDMREYMYVDHVTIEDYEFYYRDREIEKDDLEEEAKLRENQDFEHIKY